MSLDNNKISNIIGTKLPQWVIKQLNTRSVQNSRNSRDNNNILYLGNKTAWVRLISSIDVNGSDLNYFRTIVGEQTLTDQTDLAKQYVLFGGTSIYKDEKYQLRSGISNIASGQIKDGAYGILGKDEIAKYGYRPMPGITSVTIETQGRLGSIRSAIINFKVWDKAQLDIIDALYFKLGYTMFLEWGHTFYYNSPENPNSTTNIDLGKVKQTELLSINPFADNLTKENIFRQISQSSRKSEGNYDAMLGMVTNFNFVYNQEGGYDCTLRLMSLGVLGDSIKINNPSILPNLLRDEIVLLNKTLIQASISESITDKETKENKEQLLTFDQLVEKYVKYPNGKYPKEKLGYTDSFIIPKGDLNKADVFFDAKDSYGDVFGLRRLKTIVPLDKKYFPNIKAVLDITNINTILQYKNYSLTDEKNYEKNIPSFSESIKAFFKSLVQGVGSPISLSKTLIVNSAIAIDQTQRKSTLDYEIITYDRLNRGIKNNIEISRNIFAITSQPSVSSPYYFISNEEFYNSLIDFLSGENKVKIKNIESEFEDQENWREYKKIVFTFEFDLIFNKPVTLQRKVVKNLKEEKIEEDSYADFRLGVIIKTDDTGLIKFLDVTNIDQPSDYFSLEANKQLELQNQIETDTAEAQKLAQQELSNQVLEALSLQSALEISLRTIQVRALNSAFYRSSNSKADLDIGKKVYTFEMTRKKSFINQIFSNGIYSEIIQSLIYNPDSIKESEYNKTDELQFAVNAKYGFVTSLLANKADFQDLSGKQVNYKDLLKAYVVPYKIDTELIVGVKTNHPVYIPFGTLLMLLNHTCTIYDTKKGGGQSFQKPVVYIDYNPNMNFMLTNPQQLTTNPWVTLVPYQGSFEDYKNLFDKDIISGDNIIPISGSNVSTPLFNPQTQDLLSYQLPSLKDDIIYRGKIMNILLNIDYLTSLVRDYSFKDGSNNVYLKPFLEQILSDVNKYLGNFNALRLSYNDSANTFQIVDDQLAPALSNEVQIPANPINDNIENRTELPLLGLSSIAKSLEIKTEVSTKLSSMIAISANSNPSEQAQLSTNGDTFGFINVNYTDRYVPRRLAAYDSGSAKKNGEIIASNQFNQTVSDFYSKINPSYADVSQATSFYIEKMSKVKNNDPASRASALIPVSVNLTTDGLSGISMGQAFTIPKELLPYTYISKKPGSFIDGYVNQVGFAIVGLTHTIEGNSWNTTIKAQMLPVKQSTVFDRRAEILNRNEAEFGEAESLLSANTAKFINDTPWSAAFISYVMDQTSNSFPVDANHNEYLNKIKASNTGFKLYNPRYTALQVGDIVIYNRGASKNTYDTSRYSGESHGDIIVEISTNLAVGIGGNVSQTVKKTQYSVDNSGKVTPDTGVFIIARPPKETVSAIIVLANREYNLWEQGTLKETNIYALSFLKKYYESVGLKIPS